MAVSASGDGADPGYDPCVDDEVEIYLNLPEVRRCTATVSLSSGQPARIDMRPVLTSGLQVPGAHRSNGTIARLAAPPDRLKTPVWSNSQHLQCTA